ASGSFTLAKFDLTPGTYGAVTPPAGASALQFTLTSGTLFAGIGGSLSGTTATAGTQGLSVALTSLKLAFVTGGYSAVALNNAAVSLVGLSGLTLNVANLDVLFNGAPTASRLDWTAIPELTGYDGLVSTLSFKVAGDVGLSLASDLVVASGSFTLAKFDLTPGTYGAVTLPAGASALQFTLTSGLLFAGIGGSLSGTTATAGTQGLSVTISNLKLAFVTGGYSAVALNNAGVSLVGLSGFTLNVANLDVLFNGAPAASRLDWTAIPELTGYDGLVSTLSFKVAGDVGLSLASDLVVASGSFTLAKFDLTPGTYGAVTLPAGASALQFTLTSGTLFAGIGGSLSGTTATAGTQGLSVTLTSLKLAFVTGGYSAVALNNAAVSLVGISGFTLNVANLDVLFNGAPAASRLDWTAIPELTGYDGLVSTLSFKVAGDVGLSLANDLVVASGSFTLAKFDLTPGIYGAVTLPAGASALEFTLTSGLLFAGVGGS